MASKPPLVALLTTSQHKLDKGRRLKWATCGIQLAPANSAKLGTVCASAGICASGCLDGAGRNRMPRSKSARVRRTILFKRFTSQFFAQAHAEITLWKIQHMAQGFRLAMRPNVLSDLPTMAHDLARQHPEIQFYDYTKLPRPASRRLANYHLTYSYSERTTPADVRHCIDHRVNLAVIFATGKREALPRTVSLHGHTFTVIDGDRHDLRFLDPSDSAHVVGLRWKSVRDNADVLQQAITAGAVVDPAALALVRAA